MEYVNQHGQPVNIEAAKSAAKKKSTSRGAPAAFHKGWIATGFPPQQLLDAKKAHHEAEARAAQTGRSLLPWSEGRYMRDAKPTKVRHKPYETAAAAREAATLAERMGWLGCNWSEVSKGAAR